MVLFKDEVERERILNQENWFVVGHVMYIQSWTPNFNPIPLVVYSNPIWISLYNLPIEYWGEVYLEKIGRMLGTVLEVDFDDERDLCKIVRIWVAAVRKIPEVVFLRTTNGIWRQSVEVENVTSPCERCGSNHHNQEQCKMFVRRAYNLPRKPIQHWRRKKVTPLVMASESGPSLDGLRLVSQKDMVLAKEIRVGEAEKESDGAENLVMDGVKEADGGVGTNEDLHDVVMRAIPLTPNSAFMGRGLSDTKADYVKETIEGDIEADKLENLDPRCLSQLANALLGKGKGIHGRRSNKQKREEREK